MRGWSVILAVCGQLLAVGIAQGQCAPGWTDGFANLTFTSGAVRCFAKFDEDGPGPKPAYWFLGGDFSASGCTYLGRYDGQPLSRVREGNSGVINGPVHAMVVFDDDGQGPNREALFVCGAFHNAGSHPAYGLAKWNGTNWTGLGGPDLYAATPRSMVVFDENQTDGIPPALYIGSGTWLWRYNSASLKMVNQHGPLNGPIRCLAVYDDDGEGSNRSSLYAGGDFTHSENVQLNHIARWSEDQWEAMGAGLNGDVLCMTVFDDDRAGSSPPSLFAGGAFRFSAELGGIAFWDGTDWSHKVALPGGCIGSTCPGGVTAMVSFDADGDGPARSVLIAGGNIYIPSQSSSSGLLQWDGQDWSILSRNNTVYSWGYPSDVYAIAAGPTGCASDENELIIGRNWAAFDSPMLKLVAKWNQQWSFLINGTGTGLSGAGAIAAVRFGNTGVFPVIQKDSNIVRWDGWSWKPLGSIEGGSIRDMLSVDGEEIGKNLSELIVAGGFSGIEGVASRYLALWNKSSGWHSIEPPLEVGSVIRSIQYLTSTSADQLQEGLYAVGNNLQIGNQPPSMAMQLNEDGWHAIMPPGAPAGTAYTSVVFDEDGDGPLPKNLIIGGSFSFQSPTEEVKNVGRWDGTQWRPMPGIQATVHRLIVVDSTNDAQNGNSVYALANSGNVARRWEHGQWIPVAGFDQISHIFTFDRDGTGSEPRRLWIIGRISGDPDSYHRLHFWTGTGWEKTAARFRPENQSQMRSLILDDDGDPVTSDALYLTTPELVFGQLRSHGLARFGPPLKVGLLPPAP